jgi:hypothetical protein
MSRRFGWDDDAFVESLFDDTLLERAMARQRRHRRAAVVSIPILLGLWILLGLTSDEGASVRLVVMSVALVVAVVDAGLATQNLRLLGFVRRQRSSASRRA